MLEKAARKSPLKNEENLGNLYCGLDGNFINAKRQTGGKKSGPGDRDEEDIVHVQESPEAKN